MNEMGLVIKRGQMTNIKGKTERQKGKNIDHYMKILDKLFFTTEIRT